VRTMRRPSSFIILSLALLAGCRGAPGAAAGDAPAPRELALSIRDGAPGLSFRFIEPVSGRARTALSVADIPEVARALVMVYDESLPVDALAPGETILADLRQARDDGTYAWRIVNQVRAEARLSKAPPAGADAPLTGRAGKPAATGGLGDEVLLFATDWCPHCRTAEAWLKRRGARFQRLDVEKEPGARQLLMKLFRDKGLPAEYASSVPILYVKGEVLLGFDQAAVERALGR
jgi:glutaredoxin 3